MQVSEELILYAISDPTQPRWALDDIASDADHALSSALNHAMCSVTTGDLGRAAAPRRRKRR